MKESIRVNLNDKRLDKLSLCLKCERRAELYSQSLNKSYNSLLGSNFRNRKRIAIKRVSNYSEIAQQSIESKINKAKRRK